MDYNKKFEGEELKDLLVGLGFYVDLEIGGCGIYDPDAWDDDRVYIPDNSTLKTILGKIRAKDQRDAESWGMSKARSEIRQALGLK